MTVFPFHAVRNLAIVRQGLDAPLDLTPSSSLRRILDQVQRLGMVQIDTLHRVARSQYLVLWSRLGNYDPADFDRLAYDAEQRRLFEGWLHAACYIPLTDYRYLLEAMHSARRHAEVNPAHWINQPGNRELTAHVLARIQTEGGLRANHFEDPRLQRGPWWDWKPAKIALEYLFLWGQLMVDKRINFHRVYDLTERVLPAWVDQSIPEPEEVACHWIEIASLALGACTAKQLAAYTYRKQGVARPAITKLVKEGVLLPIQAQVQDGQVEELLIHRELLSQLERAADGSLPTNRTTFLSPFDSLLWDRKRVEQFWAFTDILEAYKPARQHKWGYFCLPILHRDRLVGRFDPKLERSAGRLYLKALYLEDGVEPSPELVAGVAKAMRSFLTFHRAADLVIERSQPEEFGRKLMAELG
jgi:hypothetical protein